MITNVYDLYNKIVFNLVNIVKNNEEAEERENKSVQCFVLCHGMDCRLRSNSTRVQSLIFLKNALLYFRGCCWKVLCCFMGVAFLVRLVPWSRPFQRSSTSM